MVRIRLIDPSLANPDEVEILEDLIVAAANDARGRAESATQEKMQELTAGLPLPEGFKHAVWNDVADFERVMDETVAAILVEPVQGEGGVNPATREFFHGIRALCDERGALMMVDEVQTGLGRTGRIWGHHHWGLEPDAVVTATSVGSSPAYRDLCPGAWPG